MGGLECRPGQQQLPTTYKIYQLASALGGETPDGTLTGDLTLDLSTTDPNSAIVRLETAIGYNRGATPDQQASPLAQHWGQFRASMSGFLTSLGGNTITPASLARIPEGDRRNASILIDSAQILLRVFGSANACADGALNVYQYAATPVQIRGELATIYNGTDLYIRMGGQDNDGGLPPPSISTPLSFSDDDLRMIDQFLGYNPASSPPAGNLLLSDWHGVRGNIMAIRRGHQHDSNQDNDFLISQTDLPQDQNQARIASVVLNSWAGILRILRSANWQAGRAYRDDGVAAPVLLTADSNSLTVGSPAGGVLLPVPAGNWPAGGTIHIDGSANPLTIGGGATPVITVAIPADHINQPITIPYPALGNPGQHSVTIKRPDGTVFGTVSFTTLAGSGGTGINAGLPTVGAGNPTVSVDGGLPTGNVGNGGQGGAPGDGNHGPSDGTVLAWVAGGLGVLAGLRFGLPVLRNWWNSRGSNPAPVQPPAAKVNAGATPPVVVEQDEALAEAARLAGAPAGGTPAGTPVVVDASNVILQPATVGEVHAQTPLPNVVEAQIRAIIPGMRISGRAGDVQALTRTLIRQFGALDAGAQADLFVAEFQKDGHITNGGLPVEWLRERSITYLSQELVRDHMNLTPTMVTDWDQASRREAERTLYRDRMPRLLRGEVIP